MVKTESGPALMFTMLDSGKTDLAALLIDHGANPDSPYSYTALAFAMVKDNQPGVKILLENGAEPFENSYHDYLNDCSQEIRTLLEEYYPSGN